MKKIIKIGLIITLTITIIILSAVLIFVVNSIKEVKNININLLPDNVSYCTIYDVNNKPINNINQHSKYIKFEEINKETIDAFISIEDKKFYDHDGLNYLRIGKAILNNIKNGKIVEGASTITQQLVKNKFLNNDRTFSRKIKEAYLTKKIEASETKEQILESYLNTIYFGSGAYGIGEASQRYFNKNPKELNLNESCILAGIIKSPNAYSPLNNTEKCLNRRNLVLRAMLNDEKISKEQYNKTLNMGLDLDEQELTKYNSLDLYSKCALHETSKILKMDVNEIISKGYKIYTYQDYDIQSKLDDVINNSYYYPENSYGNIADSLSIILDNKTSGVKAVSGRSNYNLVDFKRQPGSLIKPVFVYTPALENKLIYPCSQILDEKTSFDNYSPQNVSNKYYGYVSIREAVEKSLNIPAVKLCDELGVDKCKEFVKNCGLNLSNDDSGLATALGGLSEGFTLQNITESYLPYSNNGYYAKSKYISKIITPLNLTIYIDKMTYNKYCKPETAYMMTNIMSKNIENSTSKKLSNFDFDVAGKTGTVNIKNSSLNTDAYSLAYTSEHTMSVWMGNYSMNSECNLESNVNGGSYCTEIIKDVFSEIYKYNKPNNFSIPEGIVELNIDSLTLYEDHDVVLANNIPEKYVITEIFDINNIPTKSSTKFLTIPETQLSIMKLSSSCKLNFNTYDFLNYKIYRLSGNNKKLLKSISSVSGEYEFIDDSLDYNKNYTYYIEITSDFSDSLSYSNEVNVIIEKDYEKLLTSYNDNFSWLFN